MRSVPRGMDERCVLSSQSVIARKGTVTMDQRDVAGVDASAGVERAEFSAAFTVDGCGHVIRWSPGARSLLGYRAEDVTGRRIAELLDQSTPPYISALLLTGSDTVADVVMRRDDESLVAVELLVHVLGAGSGAVAGRGHRDDGYRDDGDGSGGGSSTRLLVATELPNQRDVDSALLGWAFDQVPFVAAITDTELRYVHVNQAGSQIWGIPANALLGRRLLDILPTDIGEALTADMRQAVDTGRAGVVRVSNKLPHEERKHEWIIHNTPIKDGSGLVRGLYTLGIDNTGEYEARRRLALVSEASGIIGSTLDIERTTVELAQVLVPALTDFVTIDLLDSLFEGQEPRPGAADGSATLRRMAAQSIVAGCPESVLRPGETDVYADYSHVAQTLASGRSRIVGLQGDHTYAQRWAGAVPGRSLVAKAFGFHSSILVPIKARGATLGVATLHRHQTPADFDEDDLLLAEEITARAGVCVDNALRYTRQRSTALTLQHSLLPQDFPSQAAVEVVGRYLPSDTRAGVGGDWFDVIPLSGARVALTVGDVVGHGIHASATMGRLRTAVRTLADLELSPDELLTRLDDIIAGPFALGSGDGGDLDTGATCIYAVYDPISRDCTIASAGHPPPALVLPDGAVEFLEVPPGPPLGLGGLPFEKFETRLPEGSLLALYTDGLIESRTRDVDQGFAALRALLSQPEPSLGATCQKLFRELLPQTPTDDAALLLARTHMLDPDHVATWEFPAVPEAVAQARDLASRQLTRWGQQDAAFATEVIVSELVTNAMKHAEGPIQLRLICEDSLICEVGDASNTYPRMRRARTDDEGGRGLLLVAQLSRRWGTRSSERGKVIWADQPVGIS